LIVIFPLAAQVLCRWILSVKKNYRPVKYHNWRHALNVAQTMFALLKTGKMEQFMTDLDASGAFSSAFSFYFMQMNDNKRLLLISC
jgi:hypothetical protein